jgi:hypothetical protein
MSAGDYPICQQTYKSPQKTTGTERTVDYTQCRSRRLYDSIDIIPFEKLEKFFKENLKSESTGRSGASKVGV